MNCECVHLNRIFRAIDAFSNINVQLFKFSSEVPNFHCLNLVQILYNKFPDVGHKTTLITIRWGKANKLYIVLIGTLRGNE